MKRNPEKLLKLAAAVAGLVGLVLAVWYVPTQARWACERYPEYARLYWPGMIFAWSVAVLCYLALWQFWKICTEIGRDNSFSLKNARSLNTIGWLMLGIAALMALAMAAVLGWSLFHARVAIRLLIWTVVFVLAAMLSSGLSNLVRRAAEIKSENDLTI